MRQFDIIVIEHDGLDERAFNLAINVIDERIHTFEDLRERIVAAAEEYCQTEEGARVLDYNCGNFNWADFETNVGNNICKRHGFVVLGNEVVSSNIVDWDEQLVYLSSQD